MLIGLKEWTTRLEPVWIEKLINMNKNALYQIFTQ